MACPFLTGSASINQAVCLCQKFAVNLVHLSSYAEEHKLEDVVETLDMCCKSLEGFHEHRLVSTCNMLDQLKTEKLAQKNEFQSTGQK